MGLAAVARAGRAAPLVAQQQSIEAADKTLDIVRREPPSSKTA